MTTAIAIIEKNAKGQPEARTKTHKTWAAATKAATNGEPATIIETGIIAIPGKNSIATGRHIRTATREIWLIRICLEE